MARNYLLSDSYGWKMLDDLSFDVWFLLYLQRKIYSKKQSVFERLLLIKLLNDIWRWYWNTSIKEKNSIAVQKVYLLYLKQIYLEWWNKFFLTLFAEEEAPLNLSIKANDVSSTMGRKSEIWSPGTVCEREAKETRVPSSRSPSSTPVITRPIHHSPLTPPSSSERTFQVFPEPLFRYNLIKIQLEGLFLRKDKHV